VKPILQANEAFYLAFQEFDLDAMEGLWSGRPTDVCIHPGWSILRGWADIRESWTRIFSNTTYMRFAPSDVEVHVVGQVARVTCVENIYAIQEGHTLHSQVAGTNVFEHIDGRWLLTLHHGSPLRVTRSATPDADA